MDTKNETQPNSIVEVQAAGACAWRHITTAHMELIVILPQSV